MRGQNSAAPSQDGERLMNLRAAWCAFSDAKNVFGGQVVINDASLNGPVICRATPHRQPIVLLAREISELQQAQPWNVPEFLLIQRGERIPARKRGGRNQEVVRTDHTTATN